MKLNNSWASKFYQFVPSFSLLFKYETIRDRKNIHEYIHVYELQLNHDRNFLSKIYFSKRGTKKKKNSKHFFLYFQKITLFKFRFKDSHASCNDSTTISQDGPRGEPPTKYTEIRKSEGGWEGWWVTVRLEEETRRNKRMERAREGRRIGWHAASTGSQWESCYLSHASL